ncbi:MAG: ABC transporter permease [Clostridia bacterium]|nr:ABC transporter permease [Clostridia bacterium]
MRLIDLLRMSSSNLFKRKIRTILTVLGVVIGTASIVVMISLGLGLNKSTMEQIESYGSLTMVRVMEAYDDMGGSQGTTSSKDKKRLTDALVTELSMLPNVESVSPILRSSVVARQGIYEAQVSLVGMTEEALKNTNMEFENGGIPKADEPLSFIYSPQLAQNFYNVKTGVYTYWQTQVLPDIDFWGQPVFIIFDTEAYFNAKGSKNNMSLNVGTSSDTDTGTEPAKMPKKYMIPVAGTLVKVDENRYDPYGSEIYCELTPMITQLKKIYKNKVIPGQPSKTGGKPYKEIFYSEIQVNVDTMEHVMEIQKMITEMGYQANSDAEFVESMQQQYKSIQLLLGGIGAVSLFVAAIGITNTMMMSIYERTKEIGVIKVLGCSLGNIRSMFLLEAAYIGLIGGIIGILLSYLISTIINRIAGSMDSYQSTISYIPFWLAAIGLGFSVAVGMVAGFFPALRAMRLSPLAAIRNE